MTDLQEIRVPEWGEILVPADALEETNVERLWRNHSDAIEVEVPSAKTGGFWALEAKGVVGQIPVSDKTTIVIEPKVSIASVLQMMETAGELQNAEFLEGLYEAEGVEELLDLSAQLCARETLRLLRRGLFKDYRRQTGSSENIRGTLDLRQAVTKPWKTKKKVEYSELTVDVLENRAVLWALQTVRHNPRLSEDTRRLVRTAFQSLAGEVDLVRISSEEMDSIGYDRKNENYKRVHALSRLILNQVGPSVEGEGLQMVPFLVDMGDLFEDYLGAVLEHSSPPDTEIVRQAHYSISDGDIPFYADFVVRAPNRDVVLDAKYKDHSRPSSSDISQILTYAKLEGADSCILVYPSKEIEEIETTVDGVRVRSLGLDLSGDLTQAHDQIWERILS